MADSQLSPLEKTALSYNLWNKAPLINGASPTNLGVIDAVNEKCAGMFYTSEAITITDVYVALGHLSGLTAGHLSLRVEMVGGTLPNGILIGTNTKVDNVPVGTNNFEFTRFQLDAAASISAGTHFAIVLTASNPASVPRIQALGVTQSQKGGLSALGNPFGNDPAASQTTQSQFPSVFTGTRSAPTLGLFTQGNSMSCVFENSGAVVDLKAEGHAPLYFNWGSSVNSSDLNYTSDGNVMGNKFTVPSGGPNQMLHGFALGVGWSNHANDGQIRLLDSSDNVIASFNFDDLVISSNYNTSTSSSNYQWGGLYKIVPTDPIELIAGDTYRLCVQRGSQNSAYCRIKPQGNLDDEYYGGLDPAWVQTYFGEGWNPCLTYSADFPSPTWTDDTGNMMLMLFEVYDKPSGGGGTKPQYGRIE